MPQYLLGGRNTTGLYGEIQHVLSIPCFSEYCEEQKRPLEGEGWVAAGPLRDLFLQGHTHAWSKAHRGGSGTQRLYWLCHTSVTSRNTSCRTTTLWLGGWERVLKTCSECGDVCGLSSAHRQIIKKLQGLHPTRKSAFSMWISLKARSDNEWELAIKTPLCKLYTNVPTFPHTCFDMQIAMKEIWKHSCPLLTNT